MRFPLLMAMLFVAFLAPAFISHAQEGEKVSYKAMLTRNGANVSKLKMGMTRAQVVETMGTFHSATKDGPLENPWQTEKFQSKGSNYEVMYYLTKRNPPFAPIAAYQATPVVLKDGKVVGWGKEALESVKAGG